MNTKTIYVDMTVTVSIILAVAAIISPCITAFINNRHQFRMRKLELSFQEKHESYLHKREIYEKYLASVGKCISFADALAKQEYGEWYFRVLLVSSPDIHSQMMKANDLIVHERYLEAIEIVESIAMLLRAEDSLKTQ